VSVGSSYITVKKLPSRHHADDGGPIILTGSNFKIRFPHTKAGIALARNCIPVGHLAWNIVCCL